MARLREQPRLRDHHHRGGRQKGQFGSHDLRGRLRGAVQVADEQAFVTFSREEHLKRARDIASSAAAERRKAQRSAPQLALATTGQAPAAAALAQLHGNDRALPSGPVGQVLMAALAGSTPRPWQARNTAQELLRTHSAVLNPLGRVLGGVAAEARAAQVPRQRWTDHLMTVAASAFHGSQACTLATLEWLRRSFLAGTLKGLACIKATWSDATPLDMGLLTAAETDLQAVASKGMGIGSSSKKQAASNQRAKVLQSEFQVAFVVEGQLTHGEPLALLMNVPTPLQCVDRSTADVLRACFNDFKNMPMLADVAAMCDLELTADTGGRDTANLKLAHAMSHMSGTPHTRIPCDVHKTSTATGVAYDVTSADISSIVHFALSMRGAGSIDVLRAELRRVLTARLELFIGAQPPDKQSPARLHSKSVFELALPAAGPHAKQNAIRREVLMTFLNGDIAHGHAVQWYVCDGSLQHMGEQALKSHFCDFVVPAFIPHQCPLFPRHRWTGAGDTLNYVLLLGSTNLLQQVVPGWISRLGGSAPRLLFSATGNAAEWEEAEAGVPLDVMRVVSKADTLAVAPNTEDPTDYDWAERNARARGDAAAWSAAPGTPARLVIMRIATELLFQLMHALLEMSGIEWDVKQWSAAARGQPRLYRLLECSRGVHTASFRENVKDTFFNSDVWAPLQTQHRTLGASVLSFRLLAMGGCMVHRLITEAHRSYPYKLSSALQGEAERKAILDDPECVRDELSNALIRKYPSLEELSSRSCRCIITAFLELARSDTARIECRHASLRRLVQLRSCQVRRKWPLASASADFVLMRQRVCDAGLGARQVSRPRKMRALAAQPKRRAMSVQQPTLKQKRGPRRSGGGGSWRAFVARTARGHSGKFPKGLSEAYREHIRVEKHKADLQSAGRLGTQARREGRPAFSGTRAVRFSRSCTKAITDLFGNGDVDVAAGSQARPLATLAENVGHGSEALALYKASAEMHEEEFATDVQAISAYAGAASLPVDMALLSSCGLVALPCGGSLSAWLVNGCGSKLAAEALTSRPSLARSLREDWLQRHQVYKHDCVPKIPKLPRRDASCRVAGFCCCRNGGRAAVLARKFHDRFTGIMRQTFAKDAPSRPILLDGMLVLRMCASTGIRKWYFVGRPHMLSWHCSLLQLWEDDGPAGAKARAADRYRLLVRPLEPDMGFCSSIACFRSFDLNDGVTWTAAFFKIYTSTHQCDHWEPWAVEVSSMSQELDLWPPPPPPPRLRARHANVLPGAAAPDALEDEAPDSDQEDEEADAPEEASPPDLDALLGDALDEAEVAEDLDYAAEDALPLGPRRRRRRAPDPPAPAAASSDGPAMQGPDSQDRAPVPPVLPDPRPGQDRGAAARHVRYKYIPSTTYEVGSGHIMVSFGSYAMDAHCRMCSGHLHRKVTPRPNARTANTRAQGRPLGLLLSWLHAGCTGDSALHRAGVQSLTYETRLHHRRQANAQGLCREAFEFEREAHDSEPGGEPVGWA